MVLKWGDPITELWVTGKTPVTPGMVATLRPRDVVYVFRDAVTRNDWAAMAQAIMTAYARDVHVVLAGSNPRGDSPYPPAKFPQVKGGVS